VRRGHAWVLGRKVRATPEAATPEAVVRFGRAAAALHMLPGQGSRANLTDEQFAAVLEQLGRLDDVFQGRSYTRSTGSSSASSASGCGR
jgi:Ser/Thr protein kinase RdoA (MazF antagonist)